MYCTSCGSVQQHQGGFCTVCGAPLRQPEAAVATASWISPAMVWALGLAVGAMVLFAGCAVAFDVPTRVGLIRSEGEVLLAGAPDREAAAALEAELQDQGFDMTGVDVWVLPVSGRDTNLCFVTLDESQGFTLDNHTLGDPVTDSLVALARSGALQEAGVGQVGMEYVDANGDSAATLTVPMDQVTAVANQQITPEEFAAQVEGRIDLLAAMEVLQ